MRIKLSRWQKLFVVLSVIYLIITIFIAWNKWQSSPFVSWATEKINQIESQQPSLTSRGKEPIDLLAGQREPRDLLAGQREPIDLLANQIESQQSAEVIQKRKSHYKKALRIERLKIIGIAFTAWIILLGIAYLLGFSISKSKRVFKNIRVGIILILVGIFIPTVFYPLVEPLGWVKYTPERKIQIAKGKEIHYKLYELGLVLKRERPQVTIPYKYFVASGIVLVFIGTGICVLNKDKKTTTTKNDNSIVTGNNSN